VVSQIVAGIEGLTAGRYGHAVACADAPLVVYGKVQKQSGRKAKVQTWSDIWHTKIAHDGAKYI